jgi:predicted nucleic acid-binding protein
MIAIDTNVVVRYLTGDDPDQSYRARALIDGQTVFVPVTVVLETAWVLRSAYGFPAADTIRALRSFGGLTTVTIEDAGPVAAALDLAETGMDLADALHLVRSAHCKGFASFDRRFVTSARAAGQSQVRDL